MKSLIFLISMALSKAAYLKSTNVQCTNSTNDHSVESLPGWTNTTNSEVLPCMHAGFVDGLMTGNDVNRLFYWMYKTENWNASQTPLVIYMNGGPGLSSSIGNFLFNGVLNISQELKVNETTSENYYEFTLTNKPTSWADAATMVYLDQPVGAGFSFSNINVTDSSVEVVNADFMSFMYNLYAMYPEFNQRPLYLAGEGYAAKFIGAFANQLNEIQDRKFNVTSVLLANPEVSPFSQKMTMPNLPTQLTILDKGNMAQVQALERICGQTLYNNETGSLDNPAGLDACMESSQYIQQKVGGQVDIQDVRYYKNGYDDQPLEALTPVDTYFSTQNPDVNNVYKAIHVTESTKSPMFNLYNGDVKDSLSYSGMQDVSKDYETLLNTVECLNDGIMQKCAPSMLVYAGEFDSLNGANSQHEWLWNLMHGWDSDFRDQARKVYYLNSTLTNDWQVGGYYRQVPRLTYLTVPGAGWAVDYDNTFATYNAFLDYMGDPETQLPEFGLQCKKETGEGCAVVGFMCEAMMQCQGYLGTCLASGKCVCRDQEWKGADCSQRSIQLYDGMNAYLKSKGDKWYSFYYSGTSAISSFTATTAFPIDIYITAGSGSDPTEFSYDFNIKGVIGNFKLEATDFPQYMGNTYAISIFVDGGVDFANDFVRKNTLQVSFKE